MLRTKLLVVAVLLSTSTMAFGQAGVARNGHSEPSKKKSAPERLADHLKKQGRPVEQIKYKDGAVTLTAKCKHLDRLCPVEVHCSADGKKCKLKCPLCDPTRFSSEQLVKLLGHNCRRGHFVYREADNMLCFEDSDCSIPDSDDKFQRSLDDFLEAVRETEALWIR